jgi:PBP1b-binding outer membrane lipoprotein LpoB
MKAIGIITFLILLISGCGSSASKKSISMEIGTSYTLTPGTTINPKDASTQIDITHKADNTKQVILLSGSAELIEVSALIK